jgi:hypothetical protein
MSELNLPAKAGKFHQAAESRLPRLKLAEKQFVADATRKFPSETRLDFGSPQPLAGISPVTFCTDSSFVDLAPFSTFSFAVCHRVLASIED